MKRFFLPLVIFGVLAVFLAMGLKLDPREVPSPLIGKPAPAFSLALLEDPQQSRSLEQLKGKVWVLNVWASWCGACRDEHETLLAYARQGIVPIYGLDYKDERSDGLGWLRNAGNPFVESFFDPKGLTGIDFGVYGVPETFVIDAKGIIRYKHIGGLTPEVLDQEITPLVRRLNG